MKENAIVILSNFFILLKVQKKFLIFSILLCTIKVISNVINLNFLHHTIVKNYVNGYFHVFNY